MKRKLKLKYWVKAVPAIILLFILLIFIIGKIDEGFVETCTNQSYSKTYCERRK